MTGRMLFGRMSVLAVVAVLGLGLSGCGGSSPSVEDGHGDSADRHGADGHGAGSEADEATDTTTRPVERITLDCESDAGPIDPADMAEPGSARLVAEPCTLSPARAARLVSELARVRDAIDDYPTVADALAGGFEFETPPETAPPGPLHLYRLDRIDQRIDLDAPEMLMYAGGEPDSPLITAVYWLPAPADTTPPDGFTGPEDRWHFHATEHRACLLDGAVQVDFDERSCVDAGGRWASGEGWMLHVWAVPERPNPDGIFTLDHPDHPAGVAHGAHETN